MTPLLWVGLAVLVVLVFMALWKTASDADDEMDEQWVRDQLAAWEGEGGVYDHEAGPDFDRNVVLRERPDLHPLAREFFEDKP
jgi:hypothetical protein